MKDIKPCPFCGGAGKVVETAVYLSKWRFLVRCEYSRCGADGPPETCTLNAIEAWNKRVPLPVEVEE